MTLVSKNLLLFSESSSYARKHEPPMSTLFRAVPTHVAANEWRVRIEAMTNITAKSIRTSSTDSKTAMATAPATGAKNSKHTGAFDIVATYRRLLSEDEELTMPVAAIEALILALADAGASTVSETLDLVSKLTAQLKRSIPNSISLSAGTDLFQQYLISNLQRPSAKGDFDQIRNHLVQNGKLFVERAKAARETIAEYGRHFIRDGNVVLTNGGSRVVGSLLRAAAESGNGKGSTRFKVVYVISPNAGTYEEDESAANIAALRARDIPVATIPSTAVAYCMAQVTTVFVGAEGVVENGGIVSRMGTYQMGMLAKAMNKRFYVVSESHKFVRLYPVDQHDLGIEQNVVDFQTADGPEDEDTPSVKDEGVADVDERGSLACSKAVCGPQEAVDYTPPHLISGIITESGVLLPSAVSEVRHWRPQNKYNFRWRLLLTCFQELIKIWF